MDKLKQPWLRSSLGIAVLGALTWTGAVQSGGFQITETCARCEGSRNAGVAARGDDIATMYWNPAAMSMVDDTQISANVHVIDLDFEFKNKDSERPFTMGLPVGVSASQSAIGREKANGGVTAVVPAFYLSHNMGKQWNHLTAGIGITVPYGLETKYKSDWVGRYDAIETNLETININPAISFRPVDWVSLGFGFNLQYADVKLTNAIDYGTLCSADLFGPCAFSNTNGNPAYDGRATITGDNWATGFNFGILVEPWQGSRFGVSYRSKVKHNLKGRLKTTGSGQYNGGGAPDDLGPEYGPQNKRISSDYTSPDFVTFGYSQQLGPKFKLLFGAIWTNWSTFEALQTNIQGGGLLTSPDLGSGSLSQLTIMEDWKDSWRFSIGGEYQLTDRWRMSAGFEYDMTPVKRSDLTARIPDADRYWLAFGVGYQALDWLSFDAAYTHIFIKDFDIDSQEGITNQLASGGIGGGGNRLVGEYSGGASIYGLSATMKF